MEIEFDETTYGDFINGKDFVGHWVLFQVIDKYETEGAFGTQTVAVVNFADLSSDEAELLENVRISNPHIVKTLNVGKTKVGMITRNEAKQKGYQGAIILTQPKDPAYESAKTKATNILLGKAETVKPNDELEDLLG